MSAAREAVENEHLATGLAEVQLNGEEQENHVTRVSGVLAGSCEAQEDLSTSTTPQQASGGEAIQALPPPPSGLEGESRNSGKHYSVTVSNKAGYMCHVHVVADWPVEPEVPFKIFTHPDNSRLFRDIQRVGSRNVIKMEPNYKEVQVEQLGEIQVLWMKRTYSTWLKVVEDARDPDYLRTEFHLMRSDVLGKFSGAWELRAVRDPVSGKVVGCHGELHQDVLPKGMPSFLAHMPVLGNVLRGISVRAVTRVLDDMNIVMDKVRAGHAAGRSTEAVLRDLCGPISEAAHSNGAVASFAFETPDDEEEEEEGKAEECEPESGKADGNAAGARGQDGSKEDLMCPAAHDRELKPEVLSGTASGSPGAVHVVAEAVSVNTKA